MRQPQAQEMLVWLVFTMVGCFGKISNTDGFVGGAYRLIDHELKTPSRPLPESIEVFVGQVVCIGVSLPPARHCHRRWESESFLPPGLHSWSFLISSDPGSYLGGPGLSVV